MAVVGLDSVLACLDVEAVGEGRWRAPDLEPAFPRVFGGQLLAQVVALASVTTPGKSVKSVSCLFPREGHADRARHFEVEETHDGRGFATRRVVAIEADRPFCVAQVSLHVDEEGPEHQGAAPEVEPAEEAVAADLGMIPWPCRVVGGVDLADRSVGPAEYGFWTRLDDDGSSAVGSDAVRHQALLAYATDLTVIGTGLRPHVGLSQADAHESVQTAVTAHTIWFHRTVRLDRWCLVSQRVPVTTGARGFGTGEVWDPDGLLLASFAQEFLLRPTP